MRVPILIVFAAACGGGDGGLEVDEAMCSPNQLTFVHDLSLDGEHASGEGSIATGGVIFGNAGILDDQGKPQNGVLILNASSSGASPALLRIEFEDALLGGGTVDARGSVKLVDQGIDAGNCETAGFSGRLTDFGDGWKFTLVELHASPYCGGASFGGSFAGCTRSAN